MTTYHVELVGPHLYDLRQDRRIVHWPKRGRGGTKTSDKFAAAFLKIANAALESKGDAPPFFGPVLVTIAGYWPPMRSGYHQGEPSESTMAYGWAVTDALKNAGVIGRLVTACICTSHVGTEPMLRVTVRNWEEA